MWVPPGASTVRTCSSSISDPSSSANSRSPSPRRTGAKRDLDLIEQAGPQVLLDHAGPARERHVLPARRLRGLLQDSLDALGDEVEGRPALHLEWLAGVVGDDEDGHVVGGVLTPPTSPVPSPRTGPTPEHVPPHDDGADVLPPASNHGGARVGLAPAALLAVHLAEDGERHNPLVEALAAHAEGILHALSGPATNQSRDIDMVDPPRLPGPGT